MSVDSSSLNTKGGGIVNLRQGGASQETHRPSTHTGVDDEASPFEGGRYIS